MNKGLEVVEARWLFNIPEIQIEVLFIEKASFTLL